LVEAEVLGRLVRWAESDERIRALILESSRAGDPSRLDRFSDFDILVVVADTAPFVQDEGWQSTFGRPMVRLPDHDVDDDRDMYMRLVL
jgi:aminoglycoside 6-adenylyltransferase